MERSQRLRSFQSKIFPTTIELWKIPQPFERKPNEQTRWKLSDLVAQYAGAHRWRSPGKFLDNGCRATWEQFASPWRFQATVRNIPKLNGKRLFGTRSRTCIAERERKRGSYPSCDAEDAGWNSGIRRRNSIPRPPRPPRSSFIKEDASLFCPRLALRKYADVLGRRILPARSLVPGKMAAVARRPLLFRVSAWLLSGKAVGRGMAFDTKVWIWVRRASAFQPMVCRFNGWFRSWEEGLRKVRTIENLI